MDDQLPPHPMAPPNLAVWRAMRGAWVELVGWSVRGAIPPHAIAPSCDCREFWQVDYPDMVRFLQEAGMPVPPQAVEQPSWACMRTLWLPAGVLPASFRAR